MPEKKSIKEKTDKRRRAKVKIGTDANGKPVYKYASGTTAKELADSKREILDKYVNKTRAVRDDVIFGKYAQEWYDTFIKDSELSVSTKQAHATYLNKHILPRLGDRQIGSIRNIELQKMMNELGKKLSRKTCSGIYITVLQIFKRALVDGITTGNQCVGIKVTGAGSEGKRPLTKAETDAVLKLIDTHEHGVALALLYYTGMRIGEIMGLMWRDVDLKKREIKVTQALIAHEDKVGETKTDNAMRTIPMLDGLYAVLHRSPGIGGAYVIPVAGKSRVVASRTIMFALRESIAAASPDIERDAEYPDRAAITAHYFRHNFGTVLYYNKVDVTAAQKILGHADISTTMQFYVSLTDDQMTIDVAKMEAAFANKIS